MKTIGELRQFLRGEENQTLTIGLLKIQYTADIDIHLDNELIMWINNEKKDDCLLQGDNISSLTSSIEQGKKAIGEKVELEQKLAEAEEKIKDARDSMGKVEAYEKLLIGRSLQISK